MLHIRTSRGSVFELFRRSPPVARIVELRASVALATQPRRSLALLGLVVSKHVRGVLPARVLIDHIPLLVEAVGHNNAVAAVHKAIHKSCVVLHQLLDTLAGQAALYALHLVYQKERTRKRRLGL